jgi:hypothetical protein
LIQRSFPVSLDCLADQSLKSINQHILRRISAAVRMRFSDKTNADFGSKNVYFSKRSHEDQKEKRKNQLETVLSSYEDENSRKWRCHS